MALGAGGRTSTSRKAFETVIVAMRAVFCWKLSIPNIHTCVACSTHEHSPHRGYDGMPRDERLTCRNDKKVWTYCALPRVRRIGIHTLYGMQYTLCTRKATSDFDNFNTLMQHAQIPRHSLCPRVGTGKPHGLGGCRQLIVAVASCFHSTPRAPLRGSARPHR